MARNTATGSKGFTLVELLIVISLISILAAMGLVQYRNSVQSSKEAVLRTDLRAFRDVIDKYYADIFCPPYLFNANGSPISISGTREGAADSAVEHELVAISLH